MNWDDLRIFLALARARTMSAAGRRLGLDPTTVARRVIRLETEIGRSLFEVTPAGHILTPRGQELMTSVQAMESAAIACSEGGSQTTQPGGTLRVSVSEGLGTWVIAPALVDFSRRYPDIGLELVASTGFLNPSKREADLAIMLARPKRGPLLARKLTDYSLGMYAEASLAGGISFEKIGTMPLIGYISDLLYAPELDYLAEAAPDLAPQLTSTSVNAQAALIRSGAGLGILPCFIGDADAGLTRICSSEIDLRRSFYLVVHKDLRTTTRVKLFVDWLDKLVTRLQPLLRGQNG